MPCHSATERVCDDLGAEADPEHRDAFSDCVPGTRGFGVDEPVAVALVHAHGPAEDDEEVVVGSLWQELSPVGTPQHELDAVPRKHVSEDPRPLTGDMLDDKSLHDAVPDLSRSGKVDSPSSRRVT